VLVSCYRHRANKFSKLINEGPLANLCHVSICHHLGSNILVAK